MRALTPVEGLAPVDFFRVPKEMPDTLRRPVAWESDV